MTEFFYQKKPVIVVVKKVLVVDSGLVDVVLFDRKRVRWHQIVCQ